MFNSYGVKYIPLKCLANTGQKFHQTTEFQINKVGQ